MQKLLAERGYDPRTSGLWAQHASTALHSSIQQADWKPVLLNVCKIECPHTSRMPVISYNLIGPRTLLEPLNDWSIAAAIDNWIAECSTGQYDYLTRVVGRWALPRHMQVSVLPDYIDLYKRSARSGNNHTVKDCTREKVYTPESEQLTHTRWGAYMYSLTYILRRFKKRSNEQGRS
jgi:hypothetical protein